MRIEELILDGFKSYAARTVIAGWDPEFNVITGRNGAGKSNILDAICFVLGISNLQAVRAVNLQELIYKNGQAGITRATVTIVFNNEDVAKSPVGFENVPKISIARQIMVGGKNKYMINGRAVLQAAVANMFQSVGLNVNNPNFLIMQGKITRVPKMRPMEVLAMIEETAGTRMYEERKEKGLKVMAKKDKKIAEIQSLLDEEITPKLDKIRSEKRVYMEFLRLKTEVTRLERLCIAYDFTKLEEEIETLSSEAVSAESKLEDLKAEHRVAESLHLMLQSKLDALEKQNEDDIGALGDVTAQSKDLATQIVSVKAQLSTARSASESEQKRLAVLKEKRTRLEKDLKKKTVELNEMSAAANSQQEVCNSMLTKVEDMEQILEATKNMNADDQESAYKDQLATCRLSISTVASSLEQLELEAQEAESVISSDKPAAEKALAKLDHVQVKLDALDGQLRDMKSEQAQLGFSEERETEIKQQLDELKARKHDLQRNISHILQKHPELSSFRFEFASPSPDFDRSAVKGTVGELVTVLDIHEDDKMDAAVALEICAGGRLYNVVVDSGAVGAELLERGKLRRRVTLIPLDKISPYVLNKSKLERAQKVGGGPANVQLALDMVSFPAEVTRAIEYVFGGTLICRDAETSKKVTFDPQVRARSVTLEGDVYDPSGSLSGGSKPSSSGLLNHLKGLRSASKSLEDCSAHLAGLEKESHALGKKRKAFDALASQIELKAHERSLLQQQYDLDKAKVGGLSSVRELESRLVELKQLQAAAKTKLELEKARMAQLEADFRSFGLDKSAKISELEARLGSEKKQAKKAQSQLRASTNACVKLRYEVEAIEKQRVQVETELSDGQASERTSTAHAIATLESELGALIEKQKAVTLKLDELKQKSKDFASELQSRTAALKSSKSATHKLSLAVQQMERDMQKCVQHRGSKQEHLRALVDKHDWIEVQKPLFGKSDTPFDFEHFQPESGRRRLDDVQQRLRELGRSVNERVMEMSDRLEKRETLLKQNMATIHKDRAKIEKTIARLDAIKREALYNTWQNVNRDFGATLNEMFPGNTAKLEPPAGQDFTAGLEFRVCLGGVWKESTTELSGGQCSLIALALLFSILQVKPAPLYILDEVDAALDASHTQNIGKLIRTRFKGAQFVVVSLKDGLFDNANVKFFATFKNNISCVERHLLCRQGESKENGNLEKSNSNSKSLVT